MNVAFDPWIPVISSSGSPQLISLCEVFTEDFIDLSVRPHERISLMRLFLCVAYAALEGPKDYEEWRNTRQTLPDAARKYLENWKDSFELFHKTKPWLQIAGLSGNWISTSKLNFSLATGDNHTLFDHEALDKGRVINLNETILSMVTYQCFSPGGLIGQVSWNGAKGSRSSLDSPCVSSSMIHSFPRGKSLFETVVINLLTYEDIQSSWTVGKPVWEMGNPVWEMMPNSFEDSGSIQNATNTYIGRLVPLKRLILLRPSGNEILLGDGLDYPLFKSDSSQDLQYPAEPTASVVATLKGRGLLSGKGKPPWRELLAIIVKRKSNDIGGPLALQNMQREKGYDLYVGALVHNQAAIVKTVESVFHISPKLQTEGGVTAYEFEIKQAELWAKSLGQAVETYREEIDPGWAMKLRSAGPSKGALRSKLHSTATTHYWTTVEKSIPFLMGHIEAIGSENSTPSRDAWRNILRTASHDAYQKVCGRGTPRKIRAFVKGKQKLIGGKHE